MAGPGVGATRREALERARRRLDRLDLYPRPVSHGHVRLLVVPWLFRLPWFRRFDGYAVHTAILLRHEPGADGSADDLVCHELCHVWQLQHRPIAMPLSYLTGGYVANRYELEARAAAERTSSATASARTAAPPGRPTRR